MDAFERVQGILTTARDFLKCHKCSILKKRKKMVFYQFCGHLYCLECINKNDECPICGTPHDEARKIWINQYIFTLYGKLQKYELPLMDDVKKIYKKRKKSKKRDSKVNVEAEMENDSNCKNDEPEEDETKTQARSKATKLSKNTLEEKNDKNNSNSTPLRNEKEDLDDTLVPTSDVLKGYKEVSLVKKSEDVTQPSTSIERKKITNSERKTPAGKGKKETLQSSSVGKTKFQDSPATPAGSRKANLSSPKVNINKKNAKGETLFHIACKKADFSAMKNLIQAGANISAKDNAGWTPLHDSVFSGNVEVVRFLLEAGAKVNAKGMESTTALHEAIIKGDIAVTKLLLEYGADVNAMNIFKETPLDFVTKYNLNDFKELIKEFEKKEPKEIPQISRTGDEQDLVIYKYNLEVGQEERVEKFVKMFNGNLITSLTSKSYPSHIVVPAGKFNITWGFIRSVFSGCWVVSIDWIKDSLKDNCLKPEDCYQPTEVSISGFRRARANISNEMPGLFSGCHFFFGGRFDVYNIKNLTIAKEDLKALVCQNGGTCLIRCPDPESLTLEKTVSFHADRSTSIRDTTYFVIYQKDKWDPELKYNMSHLKTLPVEWLVTCIFQFKLIDPHNNDISFCNFL